MKTQAKRKGFTLVELLAVIAIIAIVAAVGVTGISAWVNYSRFINSESGAKTVYQAAQNAMTYYKSSGELDSWISALSRTGKPERVTIDGAEHTIIAFNNTDELREFLAPFIYDPNLMTACICIEFDEASQSIYSAFYSTQAGGFTYDGSSASGGRNGIVSLLDRELSARRKLGLGYYCSVDLANVKSPNMKKLKLTTLRLNNDEQLTLEWSCNAEPGQVEFEIAFYDYNQSGAKATVLASWLGQEGQDWVDLEVSVAGAVSTRRMYFSCEGGVYTLVLDSMASAGLIRAREAAEQDSIVGIHELIDIGVVNGAVNNIYATLKVRPMGVYVDEYLASGELASNNANPLYGDSSNTTELFITKFRHLYNIRYRPDDAGTTGSYTLGVRHLSWERIPVIVSTTGGGNSYSYSEPFPSIPLLPANCTLDGKSNLSYEISKLKLGRTSVCEDDSYLGLFIELQGRVNNLKLSTAELSGGTRNYTGVGVVCGLLNGGSLNTVAVTSAGNQRVSASILGGTRVNGEEQPAGLGGLVGIAVGAGSVELCSMNGAVEGMLYYQDEENINAISNKTAFLPIGIGGIIGYSRTNIQDCTNNARVIGNNRTGGIVGTLHGEQIENPNPQSQQASINTVSCAGSVNYGVISCSVVTSFAVAEQSRSYGHCFGGIMGYCEKSNIIDCENASGLGNKLTDYLDEFKGKYVGGIVGLSNSGFMSACSTREGSFVTGASRVGGIVGGFEDALLFDTESKLVVAENSSSVIGIEYVGGIIGENPQGNTISGCVNTGTVLAKQRYAGGVCGKNEGAITSCASYVYDYGNRLFNTLLEFADATEADRFRADYVGGIAGYNNGSITFDTDLNQLPQKDLASIVIGGDYVGGLVGYNDVEGEVLVHYDIIGGKIDGECFVGAFIGYNVSENVGSPHEYGIVTVSHFGVNGRNFVGGAIGAYIKTDGDGVKDSKLEYLSDNRISVVSGVSCVGGLVGYVQVVSDMTDEGLYDLSRELIRIADEGRHIKPNDSVFQRGIRLSGQNNSAVEAGVYGGGIVGYCEPKSTLVVEDSSNSGNVSRGTQNVAGIPITRYSGANELLNNEQGFYLGGIIGVNDVYCTIDDCSNTGVVSADSVIGGICGLNLGLVHNCRARVSIGTARSSYVGGIVGINASTYAGSLDNTSLGAGISCRGKKYVGGVCGMNLGVLEGFKGSASCSVSASGDCAGGIAGYNSGTVTMDTSMGIVSASADRYAGGLVGSNSGVISYDGSVADVVTGGSISAGEYAGGLIGRNLGSIVCVNGMNTRASVSTRRGYAGGIIGLQEAGVIEKCHNYGEVATAQGYAGGITSLCGANAVIRSCTNHANVSNNYSGSNHEGQRAGGIAAVNNGYIQDCTLINDSSATLMIAGKLYLGGICAENLGTLENCAIQAANGSVIVSGSGTHIGAACGINQTGASITGFGTSGTVSLQSANGSFECIGGAVGRNLGTITGDGSTNSTVTLNISFSDGKYVGGIVGDNQSSVSGCVFVGSIRDTGSSGGGRCIGGIVGRNGDPKNKVAAAVVNCKVSLRVSDGNTMVLGSVGVYTASVSDHHSDKAGSATLIGCIAGANYNGASLIRVFTEADNGAFVAAKYGLLGGITGYNNGEISCAGGIEAEQLFFDGSAVRVYKDIAELELQAGLLTQSTKSLTVTLQAGGDGLVGGVTGLNGQYGSISCVATGRWQLENRTSNPDSPIGGIIGLNETEQNLNNLINYADVWRRDASKKGYASGGMIGRQECRTMMGWIISRSINYGTIIDEDSTPRNGGVIGVMKYNGGTIIECINHGDVKGSGAKKGGGGIIGRMFWFNSETTMNIVSCVNHGEATAGMIELTQPHYSGDGLTLNIVDCINYGSCTSGMLNNIMVSYATDTTLKRCRNYGRCTNGILGAAAASRSRIIITDCFSINATANNIISSSIELTAISSFSGNNYYMNSSSFSAENSLKSINEIDIQGETPPEEPERVTFGLYSIKHKGTDYTDTLYSTGEKTGNQIAPALMFNGSIAEGDRWSFRRAAANNGEDNKVTVDVALMDDHDEFHAQDIARFMVCWFSTSNRTPSCKVYYSETGDDAWVYLGIMGGTAISTDKVWNELILDQAVTAKALRFEFNSTHRYISAYELQIFNTEGRRIDVYRNPPIIVTPPTPGDEEYDTAGRVIAEQLFHGTYGVILAQNSATHVHSVTEDTFVDYLSYSADPLGKVSPTAINAGYTSAGNTLFYLRGEEIKAVGDTNQTVGDVVLRYPAGAGIEDISDKYVLDYYERLDGLSPFSAPMNLSLSSEGMSNIISFTDSNANTKLYELNIYLFGSAESAQSFMEAFDPASAFDAYNTGNTSGLLAAVYNREAYTASYEFQTESEWESKYCVVSVRCCGQVSKSDYSISNCIQLLTIIDEPKVRFEMVKRSDDSYRYLASVENSNSYAGDWRVSIATTGNARIVNSTTPYQVFEPVNDTITASWQAWVYEDGKAVAASAEVTAQTNIPGLGGLHMTKLRSAGSAAFHGTDFDGLNCTVQLSRDSDDRAPVYRVELVRRTDGVETVVAYGDFALSAKSGTPITATLNNLPENLFDGVEDGDTEIYLRCFISSSGMGPVYYYHDMDTLTELDEGGNVVYTATSTIHSRDMAEGEYRYLYSVAMDNRLTGYYNERISISSPEMLPAPVINPEVINAVSATSINHTFSWDADVSGATYNVELYGLLYENGEAMPPTEILLSQSYGISANSITLDGSDWGYERVRLRVARVGSEQNGTTVSIGRSGSLDFNLPLRLARIGIPTVTLANNNDILYEISWLGLADEAELASYEVYLRYPVDNVQNFISIAVLSRDSIIAGSGGLADGASQVRSVTVDLEPYAEQTVSLFIVARPTAEAEAEGCVYSPEGESFELEVLKRMQNDIVSITHTWQRQLLSASFTGGGLSFELKSTTRLTGNYVASALLYETMPEAVTAENWQDSAYLEAFNLDNPISLSFRQESIEEGVSYYIYEGSFTSIGDEHAGKPLVIMARATSPLSISSAWSFSAAELLPKVQLDAPRLGEVSVLRTVTGEIFDNSAYQDGEAIDTEAEFNCINWQGVDHAVGYQLEMDYLTDATTQEHRFQRMELSLAASRDETLSYDAVLTVFYGSYVDGAWVEDAVIPPDVHYLSFGEESSVSVDFGVAMRMQGYGFVGTVGNRYFRYDVKAQLTINRNDDGDFDFAVTLPDPTTNFNGIVFVFTKRVSCRALSYNDEIYPPSEVADIND